MPTDESSDTACQFNSDRAIQGKEDDKLNRFGFAQHLAHALSGWKGTDSLVVGLYGSWGIGKSSLKNLVLEELRKTTTTTPLIADLNVWEFANRDRITTTFFDQLGIALRRGTIESKSDRKGIARKWRTYTVYLTSASDVVGQVRSAGVVGASIIGAALFGLSFAVTPSAGARIAGAAMLVAAALLKCSSGVARAVADALENRTNTKTLREVKDEVQETLANLGKPFLVILDDLDRLTPTETIEVLQLVKANADFRGVVYLVLCDRDVVERHIEKALGVSGRDYLEKIVQVAFTVPALERSQLRAVLFDGLNRILRDPAVSKRFEETRWGNVFHDGMEPYFKTLRDVNRFLSTLAFHVSVFRNERGFEVNPVDLIALEVLRIFEPDLYRALPAARDLLTGRDHGFGGREESNAQKASAKALVDLATPERRANAQGILIQLFPRAHRHFGGSAYMADFNEGWFRAGRVCAPELFAKYFGFAIPVGDVSQAALDRLIAMTADRSRMRAELITLDDAGLLSVALDRFEAYKQEIPLDHTTALVTAIFDIGDRLPRTTGLMIDNSPAMHATRIIYFHLRKEPDGAKRLDALATSIVATDGLFLPVDFVSTQAQGLSKRTEGGATDDDIIDVAGLEILKKLCLQKIELAAADGRLAQSVEMLSILRDWRAWAGEEAPRKFCEMLIQTPRGALQLICAFEQVMTSQSAADRVPRQKWYINLSNLERFTKPETVEEVLGSTDPSNLTASEGRALENLRKAMRRRRAGKAEYGSGRMSDDLDE